MTSRSLLLLAVFPLLTLPASSEKISVAPGMTVTVPETWSAVKYARAAYSLEHRTQAGEVDASMVIQVEKRTSHAGALQRLATLRMQYPDVSTFSLIAGWPALERKVLVPFQRPGEQTDQLPIYTPQKTFHAMTAVAAGEYLIRFNTLLQPGAKEELADQALTIARTLTAPKADQSRSEQELRELQSGSAKVAVTSPRAYAAAAVVSPAELEARRHRKPSQGGGSILVSGPPAGEIEATASLDGQNIVTDAACGLSYSINGGASFAGSNVNFSGVPTGSDGDCSVAWGPSGNFYLTRLGKQFVALAVSTAPNDGANFSYQTLAVDRRPTSTYMGTNVDQPHVVTDRWNQSSTGQDLVYVVWQETSNYTSSLACSSDSGATWSSTPVTASSGDLGYPRAAVGKDGMVYVVSRSWPNEIILDKFSNCDNSLVEQSAAGFPVTITFSDAYGINCENGAIPGLDRCNDGNTMASPTVVVDDVDSQLVGGNLQYNHVYMAYAQMNSAQTGQDIMVMDSQDGGVHWTNPVAANGSATAVRFMPWLGTWGGVAYLGWYDRRFAGTTAADPDDFTRYYQGSISSANGVLTPGTETDLMGVDDPQCASGWGNPVYYPFAGTRESQDATQCTAQPQYAGFCSGTTNTCEFGTTCTGGQACITASGQPKYGDYNGLATGGGSLINIWASATAPSDLPVATSNSILAYVVVTTLPTDFFVRDWTTNSSVHDDGQEPSTDPAFYDTSDVWNQTSGTAEPFVNDWVVGDSPVSVGSNYAFARISRRAPAASTVAPTSVSADFLMADFGLGIPFIDLGTQTVTFAATDNTLVTPALSWNVPAGSSTHVCLAVQISAPGFPYMLPSLLGGSPGPSGTDPQILEDNKKAQRNLTVVSGGGAGGESWAIIHNGDKEPRNMEIEYSVDPQSAKFVEGGSLTIVGKKAPGHPTDFARQGRFVLEHMAPNEDRWVGLRFGRISADYGAAVIFRFDEVSSGKTVNGFAFGYRRERLPLVARDLLQRDADVFARLAAITHNEKARRESEEAHHLEVESHTGVSPDRYVEFLKRHYGMIRELLQERLNHSSGGDPFELREALAALDRAMGSGNADTVTAAHSAVLERFDAYMTWLRRRS